MQLTCYTQSWPSFLPRGDRTLLQHSRAVVRHGLGFNFYAKEVPDAQRHGLGLCSLLCRVGGEWCSGEQEPQGWAAWGLAHKIVMYQHHPSYSTWYHRGKVTPAYTPCPSAPHSQESTPYPFALLCPWTLFLPRQRTATEKERQLWGLLRVGWCPSRSNHSK